MTKRVTRNKDIDTTGYTAKISDQDPDRKEIIKHKSKLQRSDRQWWLASDTAIAGAQDSIIGRIENANTSRRRNMIKFARMYGNWEALGWSASTFMSRTKEQSSNAIRLNVNQSVIDAVAAKIARDEIEVVFLADGSDYFKKLQAEKQTKIAKALFDHLNFHEKFVSAFRDCEVYGTGGIKWWIENGGVCCDWIFIGDIRVDDYDGMKQSPRSLHLVEMVNKEVLMARYPDDKEKQERINSMPLWNPMDMKSLNTVVDMVRVKESWHLPSSDTAGDGRHVISCGDIVLVDEEYKDDFYPCEFIRWYNKPLGFYGRSITEEIMTIQVEINKFLITAQQCFELIGIPLIFVPEGAEVSEDVLLTNFIARMVPYAGTTPPQIVCPEPLPQQFFTHLNNLIQWAFQIVGLSQASAQSTNPLGPGASGEAIQKLVDIETTRFVQVSKNVEDFHERNALLGIKMLSKLLEQKDGTEIKLAYKDDDDIMELDVRKIGIDNTFKIKAYTVSQEPEEIAGRYQSISDFMDKHLINPLRGMNLLINDPDLKQEVNIQTSTIRLTEKILSELVEDGDTENNVPSPYMNYAQALDLSLGVYNMLVAQGCPDDRLQLVRDWLDALAEKIKDPTAQSFQPVQPQTPMAPQTAPQGGLPPQFQATTPAPQLNAPQQGQ
jgi:hypothetical protein